jgi:2-iminobutanoate/2-iminopropanoate deaminase
MGRRSIEIEGFGHANPIPAASRVGPLVASSMIAARDAGSEDVPDEVEAQLANLFRHAGDLLREAGADWRHVVKMNFYVPNLEVRAMINKYWLEHFPDPAARPARHTQVVAGQTSPTCDFVAYVED